MRCAAFILARAPVWADGRCAPAVRPAPLAPAVVSSQTPGRGGRRAHRPLRSPAAQRPARAPCSLHRARARAVQCAVWRASLGPAVISEERGKTKERRAC